RVRRRSLELPKDLTQRQNQLIPRNMALLELDAETEAFVLWLELKDEWLRPLRTALLIAPLATRLVARQPALHNAMHHLNHLLFSRLARNLQQQRLRDNPMLDAFLPQRLRNVPERERFRNRRTRTPNLLGNIFMCVFKL